MRKHAADAIDFTGPRRTRSIPVVIPAMPNELATRSFQLADQVRSFHPSVSSARSRRWIWREAYC